MDSKERIIATNSNECSYLLEKITEYFIKWNINYLVSVDSKVDILAISDDFGMQDRTLLPPDTWEKHIKSRYGKILNRIKNRYSQIKVFHHSCGAIFSILEVKRATTDM